MRLICQSWVAPATSAVSGAGMWLEEAPAESDARVKMQTLLLEDAPSPFRNLQMKQR